MTNVAETLRDMIVGLLLLGVATSKLLVNYPEPERGAVLDYLFKPDYGASLHILKVEIGGDGQSSEGTESSHMHEAWDENYYRGYEWWMMKEAKKRNPGIKLYGLPWSFPGWLGGGGWWVFQDSPRLADYITQWVLGAKKYHGLDIDYLGIWNEKPYQRNYITVLRSTLDKRGLQHVQIVAADLIGPDSWDVVNDLKKDPAFNRSVSFVGGHYTGTSTSEAAKKCGKPLWSSEDYSAYNDQNGGGCMARLVNQNYVNGLMTSTIAWNLLDSYYDALPYAGHGLMTAQQPWSGYYQVKSPIWTTAHTTQFTSIDWSYLKHSSGVGRLRYGGSYVALMSPSGKDFSIIVETMNPQSHGFCLGLAERKYSVRPQNVTFQMKGSLAKIKKLYLWYTKLGFENEPTTYFKNLVPVKVIDGKVDLHLEVNAVYTLTTMSSGKKGTAKTPPPPKAFPLPYKDDFESYREMSEANNFAQQVGVFEIRSSSSKPKNNFLRQVMITPPIHWCPLLLTQPTAVIGNYNWSDVIVSISVKVDRVNATRGVFLATRVDQGGCTTYLAKGIFFFVFFETPKFQISLDIGRTNVIKESSIPVQFGTWYKLSLKTKGNHVTAYIDDLPVFDGLVSGKTKHGFVALGSDSYGIADFDNFAVSAA